MSEGREKEIEMQTKTTAEKQLIERLANARETMQYLINTGANEQIRERQERYINHLKNRLANRNR